MFAITHWNVWLLHVNLHWTTLKTSGLSCATTSLDSSLVLNKLQYIPPCSDVYKTLVFQSEVVVREYQDILLKIVKHSTNILEQVVNSSSMVTQQYDMWNSSDKLCIRRTHISKRHWLQALRTDIKRIDIPILVPLIQWSISNLRFVTKCLLLSMHFPPRARRRARFDYPCIRSRLSIVSRRLHPQPASMSSSPRLLV